MRLRSFAVSVVGSIVLCACSVIGNSTDSCNSRVSVSDVVVSLQQGLDNFSEDQYSQLRLNVLDAYDATQEAAKQMQNRIPADRLILKIKSFVESMDSVSWDVTRAIELDNALSTAADLASTESLQDANAVELFFLNDCGTASTLTVPLQSQETLPNPVIAQPNDTLPDTDVPNEKSEALALGATVANAFSLTLKEFEVICLGEALTGVYDITGSSDNMVQYSQQFQKAFDTCGVKYTVAAD